MKLAIASDHAGYALKSHLLETLKETDHVAKDLGPSDERSVDYPDFAEAVCRRMLAGEADRGILVCGSGVGMSMAANRFRGIRAVLCMNLYVARFSRLHNDANVLCLPGRLMGEALADEILKVWLDTPFEGDRHARRIGKMDEFD